MISNKDFSATFYSIIMFHKNEILLFLMFCGIALTITDINICSSIAALANLPTSEPNQAMKSIKFS